MKTKQQRSRLVNKVTNIQYENILWNSEAGATKVDIV